MFSIDLDHIRQWIFSRKHPPLYGTRQGEVVHVSFFYGSTHASQYAGAETFGVYLIPRSEWPACVLSVIGAQNQHTDRL